MTVLSPLPFQKFFDNDGAPLAGGLVFTYAAGTTNKVVTWKDSAGSEENTNPIELDFRGECDIWITQGTAYKYVLSPPGDTDPPTNPIKTIDNILFPDSGGGGGAAVYSLRLDWDGATLSIGGATANASTWTVQRLFNGQYRISHDLGDDNYSVQATYENASFDAAYNIHVNNRDSDSVDIDVTDASTAGVDTTVHVTLVPLE